MILSYAQPIVNVAISSREINSLITSGVLMFYILMLILSKQHILVVSKILFSNKNTNIVYSDFSYRFIVTTNILAGFSLFVIVTFVYLFENHFHDFQQAHFETFALIAAIALAYVLFKTLCIKVMGYVSENDELKSKIYAIETTILSTYGLLSGFFLTLCFLNKNHSIHLWLTVILVIFAVLFTLKIFKIIMIFIEEKISPFFLILYLCALEILPIWLIIDFL
jgi:hypothetical protein